MPRTICWFDELDSGDTASAGGKGANLGELTRAGFPVPPGFVVTASAFLDAMDEGGVRHELRSAFADACARIDDPESLRTAAERLQALVHKAGLPEATQTAVLDAYHRLGGQSDASPAVAVRSSATAEDTAGTSFAGMHETYANVVGDRDLLDRLIDCWASLYGERVIAYRASRGMTEEPSIAVVVQTLVNADRAGTVRILATPVEGKRLQPGEVLVAPMTNPDWVPTIRRAAALVTDGGGMTCHAAIVARELGVPCVVGTGHATTTLHDGERVTVDGNRGNVYQGTTTPTPAARMASSRADASVAVPPVETLATRIYVNLAMAEHAAVAALPVDGVGLLRAEFMITDALGGVHPRALLRSRRSRCIPRRDVGIAATRHPRVRATARRVPHHRLSEQRVPRPRGR